MLQINTFFVTFPKINSFYFVIFPKIIFDFIVTKPNIFFIQHRVHREPQSFTEDILDYTFFANSAKFTFPSLIVLICPIKAFIRSCSLVSFRAGTNFSLKK